MPLRGDATPATPSSVEPSAPEAKSKASESKLGQMVAELPVGPEPELLVPLATPPKQPVELQVQLPPGPAFSSPAVPETYPDGAYSIAGLRMRRDAHFKAGDTGTEIVMRAYVAKIYVPPMCPEGDVCPPPKQPHVWVTDEPDDPGLRRAMLVVNFRFAIPEWDSARWKDQPDVVLEKGKRYTFKGKFRQFSDTGFAADDGLLEFVAYKPHDPDTGAELPTWIYPPGAAWHPLEIARMEEAEAAMRAKLAK